MLPFRLSLWASSRGLSSLLGQVEIQAGARRDACEPQYPSLPTTASVCVPLGFCHLSVLGATRIPETLFKLQTVLSMDAIASSVFLAYDVRAGVVPRCPYVSQNYPINSLRIACSDTSFRRSVESRACASSHLVVTTQRRRRLSSAKPRQSPTTPVPNAGAESLGSPSPCFSGAWSLFPFFHDHSERRLQQHFALGVLSTCQGRLLSRRRARLGR